MSSIKFTDAADALIRVNPAVAIAEAHGCLCGAVCVVNEYPLARWLDELLDDIGPSSDPEEIAAAKALLETLHAETVRAMREDQMDFSPLLPDDDVPLAKRAEALAQWCQGFLFGFGSMSGERRPQLPGEVEEVLRDLTQIARASAGDTEPTEDDEADYTEIVEYVRVSVQVVHDELAEHRAARRLQ